MAIDWATAIHYASLVAIAEAVRPSGYEQAELKQIEDAGYTLLQTLYGSDLATDIDPHLGDVVSFGFIAVSNAGELVAVIRGTDTILEWLHDAEFLMVPSPIKNAKGFTDDGFTAVYKSLRIGQAEPDAVPISAVDYIKSQLGVGIAKTVTVCGHSLGGALATMLTLDVALNIPFQSPASYTFASPRVGDHIFSGEYKNAVYHSYRVANRLDLVTQLPSVLPLPYLHIQDKYELKPDLSKVALTVPCLHHLTTYLWLMDQIVGSETFKLNAGCGI
jgi:predicted lipase